MGKLDAFFCKGLLYQSIHFFSDCKLISRGLTVLGGLSKVFALDKDKSSFGRIDVDSTEEVSCVPALVTTNIAVSNIAMAKLMNNLNFIIYYPFLKSTAFQKNG